MQKLLRKLRDWGGGEGFSVEDLDIYIPDIYRGTLVHISPLIAKFCLHI